MFNDFFQKFINFLNQISLLVDIVPTIISLAVGVIIRPFFTYLSKRKLLLTLSLKKNNTNIVFPARQGKLIEESRNDATVSNDTETFINKEEFYVASEWEKMIMRLYPKKNVRLSDEKKPQLSPEENIIFVGGPLANSWVNKIFEQATEMNTLKRFTEKCAFSLSSNVFREREKEYSNTSCAFDISDLEKTDDPSLQAIRFGDNDYYQFRSTENDGIIVLVKIPGKAYNGFSNRGTVHICFGYSSADTRMSPKCYSEYYKEVYRILKKNKHIDQYFLVIKRTNGMIDFTQYYDKTDFMFGN